MSAGNAKRKSAPEACTCVSGAGRPLAIPAVADQVSNATGLLRPLSTLVGNYAVEVQSVLMVGGDESHCASLLTPRGWRALPRLPQTRRGGAALFLPPQNQHETQGCVLLAGGRSFASDSRGVIHQFSFSRNAWSDVSREHAPLSDLLSGRSDGGASHDYTILVGDMCTSSFLIFPRIGRYGREEACDSAQNQVSAIYDARSKTLKRSAALSAVIPQDLCCRGLPVALDANKRELWLVTDSGVMRRVPIPTNWSEAFAFVAHDTPPALNRLAYPYVVPMEKSVFVVDFNGAQQYCPATNQWRVLDSCVQHDTSGLICAFGANDKVTVLRRNVPIAHFDDEGRSLPPCPLSAHPVVSFAHIIATTLVAPAHSLS
jgi:hypothetical protein